MSTPLGASSLRSTHRSLRGESRLIIGWRVDVPQRIEIGIDIAEFVGRDQPAMNVVGQLARAEPVGCQQVSDRRHDGRRPVERRQRMQEAIDRRNRQIAIADELDQPVDPSRLEQGNVGSDREGQLNSVA